MSDTTAAAAPRVAVHREKKPPVWPWILGGAVILGFIALVLCIVFIPATNVWTDDAFVMAHYTSIAPRITGQVTAVAITDNQRVRQGQLLVQLDPRDYLTALAQADATLQTDIAQVASTQAQLTRQPALIEQAQAQYAAANAQLAFAQINDARYHSAAATGADTTQDRQQADMQLRQAQAQVAGQRANLSSAQQQTVVLQAQEKAAQAQVKMAQGSVQQAKLNLSYTTIVAPIDGMIGELSTQIGNYVTPGAAMMVLVPLQQVYITANYREVALNRVRDGQYVRIHLDAYDVVLHGTVASIPPASGASFAPIEPNNATGNFTKIVQRLPVKIGIDPNQPNFGLLRVGMSVETTIHTGH